MPNYIFDESAAGTAVGSVMNAGQRGQNQPAYYRVRALRVTGSATAGDAAVDLYYGDTYVGRFYTTVAGASAAIDAQRDLQVPDPNIVGEPGDFLNILIADASGTNALRVHVDVELLP